MYTHYCNWPDSLGYICKYFLSLLNKLVSNVCIFLCLTRTLSLEFVFAENLINARFILIIAIGFFRIYVII